jgi:hypothetical protein
MREHVALATMPRCGCTHHVRPLGQLIEPWAEQSMRKRSISGSGVAALFDPGASAGSSYFRVHGGSQSIEIQVPTELMYRLYRLGQAYGMRQLRYLESGVRVVIGSVDVPSLVGDLHRLRQLLNDPELDPVVSRLIDALELPPGYDNKSVAVTCGEYFTTGAK